MKTLSNRIIVDADLDQKLFDSGFMTAKSTLGNWRERQPVMCKVIEGNHLVKRGLWLLVHHNFLNDNSARKIADRIFALNTNENIFARLDGIGNAHSMFGNIIAERVLVDHQTDLDVPDDAKQYYHDRVRVISDGCGFVVGQLLFTLDKADYEIVYNWQGQERRVIRVKRNEIVGYEVRTGSTPRMYSLGSS